MFLLTVGRKSTIHYENLKMSTKVNGADMRLPTVLTTLSSSSIYDWFSLSYKSSVQERSVKVASSLVNSLEGSRRTIVFERVWINSRMM